MSKKSESEAEKQDKPMPVEEKHTIGASVVAAILSVFRELIGSFDSHDAMDRAKEKLAFLAESHEVDHAGLKAEMDGTLGDLAKLQEVHKEHAKKMETVTAYVHASHAMHKIVPPPPEKLHGQK
jgi:hypothetical protein